MQFFPKRQCIYSMLSTFSLSFLLQNLHSGAVVAPANRLPRDKGDQPFSCPHVPHHSTPTPSQTPFWSHTMMGWWEGQKCSPLRQASRLVDIAFPPQKCHAQSFCLLPRLRVGSLYILYSKKYTRRWTVTDDKVDTNRFLNELRIPIKCVQSGFHKSLLDGMLELIRIGLWACPYQIHYGKKWTTDLEERDPNTAICWFACSVFLAEKRIQESDDSSWSLPNCTFPGGQYSQYNPYDSCG